MAGLRDHQEITRDRARFVMLCLRCARARDMGSNRKPSHAEEWPARDWVQCARVLLVVLCATLYFLPSSSML